MPSLYSTVQNFEQSPEGTALQSYWSGAAAGAVDRWLAQASSEADQITDRRLGAPPSISVVGGAARGALQVPVSSAINIHQLDALLFARTGEQVTVAGCDVSNWASGSPYAGMISLTSPLQNAYSDGDAIQVYRQCLAHTRGKGTRGNEGDMGIPNQQSQLAELHAPQLGRGQSSRRVFLTERPLLQVSVAYQRLPWSNLEQPVDLSVCEIDSWGGYIRLPFGVYNPVGCRWRVLYTAGYMTMPYDLQDAVHLLLADIIVRQANPLGAHQVRNGQQLAMFTRPTQAPNAPAPASRYREEALVKLETYCRGGLV